MASQARPLLGELLLCHGLISRAQLEKALREQKDSGKRLGEILIAEGAITEEQLTEMLALQREGARTCANA